MEPEFNGRLAKAIKDHDRYGTQSNFAKAAGVYRNFVSEVVNGKRLMAMDDWRVWATLLNVPVEQIHPVLGKGLEASPEEP